MACLSTFMLGPLLEAGAWFLERTQVLIRKPALPVRKEGLVSLSWSLTPSSLVGHKMGVPHPTAPLGGKNETPEGGSLKNGAPHPL